MTTGVQLGAEVAEALAAGGPVVALESTVYSRLGLPSPANHEALSRSSAAIRDAGATPAVTAVIDGVPCVGVDDAAVERILAAEQKVSERDLPVAIAQRWPVGVTTVAASLALADAAGVAVFATGGIGGVHRDVAHSGDVSGDLPSLGDHPVICVSAGAKSFLDLGRTLEDLETRRVPVLGWRTDELPGFTTVTTGLRLPHRVETAAEVAATYAAARSLSNRGMLVCVPPPADTALDRATVDDAIAAALADADAEGVTGGAVTPLVLARIAAATGGASVIANVDLVVNNAAVAADIAVAIAADPS